MQLNLTPPYDKLFEGTRSEWVVAFGRDDCPTTGLEIYQKVVTKSEKAWVDISHYLGFKAFLEHIDFKPAQKQTTQDTSGLAVYTKEIKAPSDGHLHTLTVKILSSTYLKYDAYNEFIKTSIERRGYFSISHSNHGKGLWIGGKTVCIEALLESPASNLIVVPISCLSYKHFLYNMKVYLRERKMPKERLTFFGTSQEIEMMQSNGAFAVLKQTFSSVLTGKSGLAILRDVDEVYTPIMSSYDPISCKRNPNLLVMDKDIQATPILKAWIRGQSLQLPKA